MEKKFRFETPEFLDEEQVKYLEEHSHPELTSGELAKKLAQAVWELYCGKPGDDVSVAVIKTRHKILANVLTGTPLDRATDEEVVRRFLKRPGYLVVCGGTTAKIVARSLGNKSFEVDLDTMQPDVPPVAHLEGIDLTTEGILTLTKTYDLLRGGADRENVKYQTDGASSLVRLCLEADHIHFMVGQSINPGHQNPDLPRRLGMKLAAVREIADELSKRDKEVTMETV